MYDNDEIEMGDEILDGERHVWIEATHALEDEE